MEFVDIDSIDLLLHHIRDILCRIGSNLVNSSAEVLDSNSISGWPAKLKISRSLLKVENHMKIKKIKKTGRQAESELCQAEFILRLAKLFSW